MHTSRYYRGFELKIEESGNVSIYDRAGFVDKFANMSEAKNRIDIAYDLNLVLHKNKLREWEVA